MQKQKNKVGKKAKPNPTNTVTDFKAKSIVLPEQSILQDKVRDPCPWQRARMLMSSAGGSCSQQEEPIAA